MASALYPASGPRCGDNVPTHRQAQAGCVGRSVSPYGACLAHLNDTELGSYLAGLDAENYIDHRGTVFSEVLLQRLLAALISPDTLRPRFGRVDFRGAVFEGRAHFKRAVFEGRADFRGVVFKDSVTFREATFEDDAHFMTASFESGASFSSATFMRAVYFNLTMFTGTTNFRAAAFMRAASFVTATFDGDVSFGSAVFTGSARFGETTFTGAVSFRGATFEETAVLGPLVCHQGLEMSEAVFGRPVSLLIAARRVVFDRTRWAATATLRLRYASVDLAHAVFEYPMTIAAEQVPFQDADGAAIAEDALASPEGAAVRMLSLRGVDAAHLVLADVDLRSCLLAGTVHLDQIHLEGSCRFAGTPSGWRWGHPARFTRRRALAEERRWRADKPNARHDWDPDDVLPSAAEVGHVGPAQLAPVYRALRKSFEDSKDEPGAADFYFGEMEMRRHDSGTPLSERALLAAYWGLSGYGLRATRALVWLLLAMTATLMAMMVWGLPANDPKPESTGKVTGQDITLVTDTSDPVNPTGPLWERPSKERFEKSLRVVVNSVIFRSSGQDLTTAGTYTEMASRLTEPVLLGLAVLAVRGRIKR
ncbi:pentapeptide repeat-containing protein [Streptomyces sp. NPDC058155]|uniref:pentapeptide repeat-containing protein n=1 Tax=Streptomyces sp. NPDC058155 TaxID=3346359 RepID=UPI0036E05B1D